MERVCAYDECGETFTASTHNQKYHTTECCRRATNKRLMEQYYERKDRRKGRIRVCAMPDCNTRLSQYNKNKICQECEGKSKSSSRSELMSLFGDN